MDPIKLQSLRESANVWLEASFASGAFDPSRQPPIIIAPSDQVRLIEAAVSPDCSYRLVKACMDAARQEICLYMYNASADYLLRLLSDAKDRGVKVRMMFDATDTRGDERTRLTALGIELKEAPSSGGRRVFTVCHQKYAVVDNAILMIGSANWAKTSIPQVKVPGRFQKGNREWLARIDDGTLAGWFRELFEADWNIPTLEMPPGPMGEPELPLEPLRVPMQPAAVPPRVFDINVAAPCVPVRVTPIISPINYTDTVVGLIQAARTSIDVEQQYILVSGPNTEAVLRALAARKDEVQIRVIVSPAFRKVGGTDNWELSMQTLDAFGLKDSLRGMNLGVFTHLHNKGLIIDRQKVLVSSTNWSENSMARAREAGVLIESAPVAEYFAQVFDVDWDLGLSVAELPVNMLKWLGELEAEPLEYEEVHPADLV